MIDHIGIKVSDMSRSKAFYSAALAPLEYALLMEHGVSGAGFGRDMKPDFWLQSGPRSGPIHLAFASDERAVVDAFYRAAIAAGASDKGAPGVRPEYHPNYYGAFVLDPDGNNLEVVCHLAP
jgi:catechol 2,3-dioxygenase-like lactoylglutathione lyase family enzyme